MIVITSASSTHLAILLSLGLVAAPAFQGQSTTEVTVGTVTGATTESGPDAKAPIEGENTRNSERVTADIGSEYTPRPIPIENPTAVQGGSPQSSSPLAPRQEGQKQSDQRVFGVLPNYRTTERSAPFQAITTKQKFIIASKDSFDYPVFLTTAFFAGLSQLEGADNNSYAQGFKGFAHRYGIGYADQVMSNFFPEAIIPTLFHMDPRYFRKSEGSKKSRLGYAVSRIFISKADSGATAFNSPEIVGNALAALAGTAYHAHARTTGDALTQWGITYVGQTW